jgi:predicted nucleic acid-binding protein
VGVAGGGLRFWDSSALLALAVREPGSGDSGKIEPLLQRDPDVAFWWGAPLECGEALLAAQRRERISPTDLQKARDVIDHLRARAFEIQPTEELRARALRILSVHPLGAAAALELAAALIWCRERTHGAAFVSLHSPLRLAAAMEGFRVLPYADEVHAPDPEP